MGKPGRADIGPDEDPEGLEEDAGQRLQIVRRPSGRRRGATLNEADVDTAPRCAEQPDVLDRPRRGDDSHLHAVAGQDVAVALGRGRVGAFRTAGGDADGPRRQRIEESRGNDYRGDREDDGRDRDLQNVAHTEEPYAVKDEV